MTIKVSGTHASRVTPTWHLQDLHGCSHDQFSIYLVAIESFLHKRKGETFRHECEAVQRFVPKSLVCVELTWHVHATDIMRPKLISVGNIS